MHEANTLKKFLFGTLLDPVLVYTALIMTSIMYHYHSSLSLVYGLVTYIGGWMVFRLFDYINKHKLIGSMAYIALCSLIMVIVKWCADKGEKDYPIPFSLWFFTPQDAVEYNKWYTIAIFAAFFIFMTSVIYYFTRVRYRIFMSFLIFIIPFAIYGNEYEKMPTVYIILLAVGYVILMAVFRQFSNTKDTEVVCRQEIWKPLAVYAAVFAAAAALVPKPAIEADRDYIETLINADELTDRLVSMLNVFRDTSTAQQFRVKTKQTPVYYAKADEELRLKTATFTDYVFSSGEWKVNEVDTRLVRSADSPPIELSSPGDYLKAYLEAAKLDKDFAEKYGLSEFTGEEVELPPEKNVFIQGAYHTAQFAPIPQFATVLSDTTYKKVLKTTRTGLIYANDPLFASDDTFTFSYSSDKFMYMGRNKEIIDALCRDDYEEMTSEAENILLNAAYDNTLKEKERSQATELYSALSEQDDILFAVEDELLDYGGRTQLKKLSEQITKDRDSDYDKAKALEMYFYKNGYKYDLNYVKEEGENAIDFIFETKTGVCYEYASAMILLARAAGIPARFCVGYNMTEPNENGDRKFNYVVTTKDAHAFPELYIKGYGWMSFEPTIADVAEEEDDTSATDLLTRAGLIILALSLLILAAVMLYPRISHKVFLILSKKKTPTETVRAAMKRICRMYGIEGGCTSKEAAELAAAYSGTDISNIARSFDKAVYGEQDLSEEEKNIIMEEYIQAYNMYMLRKKNRRKTENSR